jgi:hypothetical protein
MRIYLQLERVSTSAFIPENLSYSAPIIFNPVVKGNGIWQPKGK